MKEIINKYKILGFILLSVLFVGCSSDDTSSVFEETPTERINSRINELRTLLKSSDTGWKAVYFTDNTQLGGFTFFFNFIDDNNVVMSSDFDDDTSLLTSKYDVVLGSTVKLSFTTKNDIHKLSDSANAPDANLTGRGYLGDFEFLYYGVDETTGDIIFRTNRTQQELRFVKATTDAVTSISESLVIPELLNDPTKSVYQNLAITSGGVTETLGGTYNPARRFFSATGINRSIDFGVAFTSTGIIVSPAIEVNGKQAKEFVYNATTDEFVADLGDSDSVVISYADAPPFLTNDNLVVVQADNAYGYIDDFLFEAPSTSTNYRLLRDEVNNGLSAAGFRLQRVSFFFSIGGDDTFNVIQYRLENIADGSIFNINHFVTFENVDGKLILTDDGWSDPGLIPFVAAIDNALTNPLGLYVRQEDFRVRFTNTIFTFTSVEDPSIRITTYAFQ